MDAETIQNTINALPLETKRQIRECVSKMKIVLSEYDLAVAAAATSLVESHIRIILDSQKKTPNNSGEAFIGSVFGDM